MKKKLFNNFSFIKFSFEIFLFLWVEYIFFFFKINVFVSNSWLQFLDIFFVWIILSFVTSRFKNFDYSKNYWKAISNDIKFYLYFGVVVFILFHFNLLQGFSQRRIVIFYFVYIFWSGTIITYLYAKNKPKKTDEIDIKILKATTYPELKEMKGNLNNNFPFIKKENSKIYKNTNELYNLLKNKFLKNESQLFHFINSSIDLDEFGVDETKVLRSADPYNVKTLDDESLAFFINLHELNDLRRINEYLIYLNKKLKQNGIFIGKFEPIRFRYRRFLEKYPGYLARVFYFFDFLWKRVSPKLPIIQKFYFAVTKGKDRALSLAEGLGRLYFSGFEVVALKEIENFIYFIAVKIKEPSTDKNPSYGPLFKMKRIGKNGQIIYVYKLRTMHPYSEYLQDYILKNFGYSEIGKPANDFRITTWGKIARKLWLDELPQLINVLKGEMKLVGVRPLSERFLKEYPEDIKKMRFKYKPGCVPPYVALLKQDVNEYIESEKIYLLEKEKNPYTTDIKYFVKAVYNILTNKIRSA